MAGEISPRARGVGNSFGVYGVNPIGTIIAWTSNLTGTPTLPPEYVQCNGQVITDTMSPYKGQTIGNLNGNNHFLRGNSSAGTTGGSSSASIGQGSQTVATTGATTTNLTYDASSTISIIPPYFNVIFCMRIK